MTIYSRVNENLYILSRFLIFSRGGLMDNLTQEQIKDKISDMEKSMRILEWDDMRQQINPAKKSQLNNMRKEYETLQTLLSQENAE